MPPPWGERGGQAAKVLLPSSAPGFSRPFSLLARLRAVGTGSWRGGSGIGGTAALGLQAGTSRASLAGLLPNALRGCGPFALALVLACGLGCALCLPGKPTVKNMSLGLVFCHPGKGQTAEKERALGCAALALPSPPLQPAWSLLLPTPSSCFRSERCVCVFVLAFCSPEEAAVARRGAVLVRPTDAVPRPGEVQGSARKAVLGTAPP